VILRVARELIGCPVPADQGEADQARGDQGGGDRGQEPGEAGQPGGGRLTVSGPAAAATRTRGSTR
jgi:hypothetical protein